MLRSTVYLIDARDKPGLLVAVARALAGGAQISFEGDLSCCELQRFPNATTEETEVLRRNTLSPIQDFVVLPLEPDTVGPILKEVLPEGRVVHRIIHVQIAKREQLAFAAYDNFHRDCTMVSDESLIPLLEALRARGLIRSFAEHRDEREQ